MRSITCSVIALASLSAGMGLMVAYGADTPYWLSVFAALLCGGLALLFGFTGLLPHALPWLRFREVRGALLVVCGVMAMYVPPQFVASAALLYLGIKLVWAPREVRAHGSHSAAVRPHLPAGTGIQKASPRDQSVSRMGD